MIVVTCLCFSAQVVNVFHLLVLAWTFLEGFYGFKPIKISSTVVKALKCINSIEYTPQNLKKVLVIYF